MGQDHPGKGKGNGEHDDKGHPHGLKLRGHYQVGEYQAEQQQQCQVLHRLLHILYRSPHLDIYIRGNIHAVDLGLYFFGQLIQWHFVWSDGNSNHPFPVLSLDVGRRPVLLDLGHLTQADHLVVHVHQCDVVDVRKGIPLLFHKAHHNVILISLFTVPAYVGSFHPVANCIGHGEGIQAMLGQLLPVRYNLELWFGRIAAYIDTGGPLDGTYTVGQGVGNHRSGFEIVTIDLHHHIVFGGASHAPVGDHIKGDNLRNGLQVVAQKIGQLPHIPFPDFQVREGKVDVDPVRS